MSSEDFFEQNTSMRIMERALIDPVLSEVSADAVQYAENVNRRYEGALTREFEKSDSAKEDFDRRVEHLINTEVEVTGIGYIPQFEGVPVPLSGAKATFMGFGSYVEDGKVQYDYQLLMPIVQDDQRVISDELYNRYVRGAIGAPAGKFPQVTVAVHMPIDLSYIDFDTMHPDRVGPWLAYEHPEIIEMIEEQVDDERPILSLANFTLRIPYPPEVKNRRSMQLRQATAGYLGDRLRLDRTMPYVFSLRMGSDSADDLETYFFSSEDDAQQQLVFFAEKIDFISTDEGNTDGGSCAVYRPCVTGKLVDVHDTSGEGAVAFQIPFNDLERFTSSRVLFAQLLQAADRG